MKVNNHFQPSVYTEYTLSTWAVKSANTYSLDDSKPDLHKWMISGCEILWQNEETTDVLSGPVNSLSK